MIQIIQSLIGSAERPEKTSAESLRCLARLRARAAAAASLSDPAAIPASRRPDFLRAA